MAGAIANHTNDVVGLSNVFVPQDDPVAFWAGCVVMIHERFSNMPIVGYESGRDLAIAQEIGFKNFSRYGCGSLKYNCRLRQPH